MSWWLSNPQRFGEERDAINAFAAGRDEIRKLHWRIRENTTWAVDLEIKVGDGWQPLTLTYPAMFPDAAPSVVPSDGRRISGHQYGSGGELCLEYRPDNWQPGFTGAMMFESALKLLSTEATPGRPPLPSAHVTTIGQDARGDHFRFVLTPTVKARLSALEIGTATPGELAEHTLPGGWGRQWMARIKSIGAPENGWKDETFSGGTVVPAIVVRVADIAQAPSPTTSEAAISYLSALGHIEAAKMVRTSTESVGLVVCDDRITKAFWTWIKPDEGRQLLNYFTLETDDKARLPDAYGGLRTTAAGIVGCGSVGSKIAKSLARSGVRRFLLVDDDVVMPGNLLRQEYDARVIGAHKVDALARDLKRINPEIEIIIKPINLGGQESGETTTAVLNLLGNCSVIVDASANPDVFNLCSAVSISSNTPMVWAEVLAGGIGGVVARARPGLDPVPHQVRRQYAAWSESQTTRWPPEGSQHYEALVDGEPLIADDAEVAVIAAHATRFVTDILCYPGRSQFPHSLYVIGLKEEWCFKQPFDAIPVLLQGTDGWGKSVDVRPENIAEALKILATLPTVPKSDVPDETVPAA